MEKMKQEGIEYLKGKYEKVYQADENGNLTELIDAKDDKE